MTGSSANHSTTVLQDAPTTINIIILKNYKFLIVSNAAKHHLNLLSLGLYKCAEAAVSKVVTHGNYCKRCEEIAWHRAWTSISPDKINTQYILLSLHKESWSPRPKPVSPQTSICSDFPLYFDKLCRVSERGHIINLSRSAFTGTLLQAVIALWGFIYYRLANMLIVTLVQRFHGGT